MEDAGFSLTDVPVQDEIKIQMRRAVEHFRRNGVSTEKVYNNNQNLLIHYLYQVVFRLLLVLFKSPLSVPYSHSSMWKIYQTCLLIPKTRIQRTTCSKSWPSALSASLNTASMCFTFSVSLNPRNS